MTFNFKTAVGGLFLLATASSLAAPHNLPVHSVSVPAVNIITDTLFNLSPLVAGKRNTVYMQQICDLARGDINLQGVHQRLTQYKIDPQRLAQTGTTGKLLFEGRRSDHQIACAAWLATSLYQPADTAGYFDKSKSSQPAKADEKSSSGWQFWKSQPEEQKTEKRSADFNQAAFMQDVKIEIAVARATAQLYAIIAQNIAQLPPADWATRQQHIADILLEYAPEYLKSIDSFYTADKNAALTLEKLTNNSYSVRNANGTRLVKNIDSTALFARDVQWFGNGKIIGKEYFVDIRIIAAPTALKKPSSATSPAPAIKK